MTSDRIEKNGSNGKFDILNVCLLYRNCFTKNAIQSERTTLYVMNAWHFFSKSGIYGISDIGNSFEHLAWDQIHIKKVDDDDDDTENAS